MKYIIMCGGNYTPVGKYPTKHFIEINGESIVGRTIRLLKEAGAEDVYISSNNKAFYRFGVPVLPTLSNFEPYNPIDKGKYWVDGFVDLEEPTCYLFGDVFFSPDAIKTIVQTDTDDIEFFASAPPFHPDYRKNWAEPFAFKVKDTKHFQEAVELTKELQDKGMFYRIPIAWELWQVIKHTPLNKIVYNNYVAINDYTCDIDSPNEMDEVYSLMRTYGYLKGV